MKDNIFNSNANPFTVPDSYFDTFQERMMNRIEIEERRAKVVRMKPYRVLIAAAACVMFIFIGATLYMSYESKQTFVAEKVIDEGFYQWVYATDETTLLAESLDVQIPEGFLTDETEYSEEDEAIIQFLERDNVSLAAIVHSFNHEPFYIP